MTQYEIRVTWNVSSIGCRVRVIRFDGGRWEPVLDRECWSRPSLAITLQKAELELHSELMAGGVLDPE